MKNDRMGLNARKIFGKIILLSMVLLLVAYVMMPYLWMVSGSFKTLGEIQSSSVLEKGNQPSFIPHKITLDNYKRVIGSVSVPIPKYFLNSVIISLGTMLLTIILSLLAAYALSRFDFRWKKHYMLGLLSTQMFPGIAFLIPYFILFNLIYKYTGIPMKNTYWGMIFTYTSFSLPFAVLMLRNFLENIPVDLDEQAQIDGCTPFGTLWRIILPVSMPGIVTIGIFGFIMAWNEILFASILTGRETKTISVGLLDYLTAQQSQWSEMMAACILVSIPVLVFFTFLQKYIVSGLVAGATKG